MANFRCEQVLVILDEHVPGFNHLKAFDSEAFASVLSEELDNALVDAGFDPLTKFLFASFDRPKWKAAHVGLKCVNAAIELGSNWKNLESNPLGRTAEQIEKNIALLSQVADVLDRADTRDRRFYFSARDLG